MSSWGTAPASIWTSSRTRYTPHPVRQRGRTGHPRQGRRAHSRGSARRRRGRLHEEGITGDVYLFKNIADSAGTATVPANYLLARRGNFSRLADILISFLVARQMMCGAAKCSDPARRRLLRRRRAEHIWEGVARRRRAPGRSSTPRRAARRRRALPAAHVIVGSSDMSEPRCCSSRRHRPGAAHGRGRHVMRDLALKKHPAVREVGHDITRGGKVRLARDVQASAPRGPVVLPAGRRLLRAPRRRRQRHRPAGSPELRARALRVDPAPARTSPRSAPRMNCVVKVPAPGCAAVPASGTSVAMSRSARRAGSTSPTTTSTAAAACCCLLEQPRDQANVLLYDGLRIFGANIR